jgi:hypothetical protein
MKTIPFLGLSRSFSACFAVAALFAGTACLHAQNAVSNLGQGVSNGAADIGNASDGTRNRIFSFTTGASASSFDFTGVTITFTNGGGSPPALNVGLYSAFDSTTSAGVNTPVSSLSLTSGNPLAAGTSVFSGTASLLPSTTYYLKLSAGTPPANNYYSLGLIGSINEDSGGLAGWSISNGAWLNYPSPGQAWTFFDGAPLISVQATASAIPEPSTYAAIAGAAMLGLAVWQRRRRTAPAAMPLAAS